MDGLNEQERALAWQTSWQTSFCGVAIIDPSFVFLAVNPQFCKITGVTPAEIIGHTFTDLTPHPIKAVEAKNAELVKNKTIKSYLLPKTYEFANGQRAEVTLLMQGVYGPTGRFLFFVATIMGQQKNICSAPRYRLLSGLLASLDKKKVLRGLGVILALLLAAVGEYLRVK